ncbi:unnamed protein product [Miscanthus lutarioriparius]|uniref:Uncharacterized protein n=1 Tax=Miscanthus lutarioriparius TaxID=422564 RepID=A0A811SU85_9POAL|nr:unnamed protein product [Miscanthus lutarioriparius]
MALRGEEELTTQLINGFTATHVAGSAASFEPLLYATSAVFALGFLRGPGVAGPRRGAPPSSFPVWRATPANLGTAVREAAAGVAEASTTPPTRLVVDQNFTASSSPLISANRRFALRLGKTYMALHMEFDGGRATAPILENATAPPIYGRLDGLGFFGLYLESGGGSQRVDVLSFDTFALNLAGVFRRMTLDDDGNLRAYYWTSDAKAWTSDYKAIAAPVRAADVVRRVRPETGDLCSNGSRQLEFDVVRRTRVSVAYKEELPLQPLQTNTTADGCELACAGNCTCWSATLVYQADDRMVGYFKVRKSAATASSASARRGMSPGVTAAIVVLSLVLVALAAAGAYWGYRMWEKRKRKRAGMEQELVPGPYKDPQVHGQL